jgi:DNA topoisomerase IA
MNKHSILALLAIKTGTVIGEIEQQELLKNNYLQKNKNEEIVMTDKGNKLIKHLEASCEYFEAQYTIQKDAEELIKKAKDKYNSILDNLKI